MKTITLVSTLLLGLAVAGTSSSASAAPISIGDFSSSIAQTTTDNPLLHQVQSRGDRNNRASDGFRTDLGSRGFRNRASRASASMIVDSIGTAFRTAPFARIVFRTADSQTSSFDSTASMVAMVLSPKRRS